MKFEAEKWMPWKNLRNLRLAKGWSVEELSKRSSVSAKKIALFEQEINCPETRYGYTCNACNLAYALDVDLDDLLEEPSEITRKGDF